MGNDTLSFHTTIYYPYSKEVSFINLHDDENTSVETGMFFLSKYGGTLMQLQHTGKRRFVFMLDGQSFSFDPNRIFTKSGIKSTLEKQSVYSEDAFFQVKKIADTLVKNYVDNKKLVIALHNNTEKGLSVLSYNKGGYEARNSARIYINLSMNPHDFMLTTDRGLFNFLKRQKINVVLQHHRPADDGSLSVYAGKKKISYINVEALHGNYDEQVRMLEVLNEIINRY